MSIQAGIWNLNDEPLQECLLRRLDQTISDRENDGQTSCVNGSFGMLYKPTHTTQESRRARQPYRSARGMIITWDGRLDNRLDLISALCPESASEGSDVALVAAAFDRWGPECFAKLLGDWAFVGWNPYEMELILSRDFIGIRPLFYYATCERLMWCSHLAPLASCGDRFTLCEEYVAGYLTMWPAADLTPYNEIRAVEPGHFIRMRNGVAHHHEFWTFDPEMRIRYKTDPEYEEHFRTLFRQAVRRRIRSESPVLAELSGGLDSSSIVCMADAILKDEGGICPKIDTFSYFDRGEPDEEDFAYFTTVEETRGRPGHHAEIDATGDSFSLHYPRLVATPGFGGRQEIKTMQENIITNAGYEVVLCGVGGDELLGQTHDPRVQMADLVLHGRLPTLAKQLTAWSLLIRRPWFQVLGETVALLLPISLRIWMSGDRAVEPWVNESFAQRNGMAGRLLQAGEGCRRWRPNVRDAFQTFVILSRQMTYTGPSDVERRYPYLDQQLVDFLLHIPPEQLTRPGDRRSLMRRALGGIVPVEILGRRTKSHDGRCYAKTLEKHWGHVEPVLDDPIVSQLGYIKRDAFRIALSAMRGGLLSPHYVRLLRALSLELWLRDLIGRGVISDHRFHREDDFPEASISHKSDVITSKESTAVA